MGARGITWVWSTCHKYCMCTDVADSSKLCFNALMHIILNLLTILTHLLIHYTIHVGIGTIAAQGSICMYATVCMYGMYGMHVCVYLCMYVLVIIYVCIKAKSNDLDRSDSEFPWPNRFPRSQALRIWESRQRIWESVSLRVALLGSRGSCRV